jgi:hypothetical protein
MAANRAEWKKTRPKKIEQRTLDELARLDRLECTYWDAWERSKRDAEVRTAKTVKTAKGAREEASQREEGQCGDPRFLEGVFRCINRRIQLLGLDAPSAELLRLAAEVERMKEQDAACGHQN